MWQSYRFYYKSHLLTTFNQRLESTPLTVEQLPHRQQDLQYQPISAQGTYLNEMTLLMQNKFHQGQLGFEVITPLKISGQQNLLLVDRGWIRKPDQDELPTILPVKGKEHVLGYIQILDGHPFTLGPNILAPEKKPLVIQKIDFLEIAKVTHQSFFPFIVKLNISNEHGYIRDWVITTVSPMRHLGYAIQWFLLAVVLVIGFIAFSCERIRS